jgi:hypothetical protein
MYHKQEKMKESHSETLWNEETKRRRGVIDNVSQTRKDEGEPFRDIME